MRVTNQMVFGNSMNNIWRQGRHINNLIKQIETGKRTQRPSDDPILASRALRYRTLLSEMQQFVRNAETGLSWMEVSEAAFFNIVDYLMERMNYRFVQAADTGHNDLDDQMAILTELREYFDQIALEMNQTHLGRYVFSGFHTSQPPFLKNDLPNEIFRITQGFRPSDFHNVSAMQRFSNVERPTVTDNVNVIQLPFRGGVAAGSFAFEGLPLGVMPLTVVERNLLDADAYIPPVGTVHFIPQTGELVFHADDVADIVQDGQDFDITYTRQGFFAGEMNPMVYFRSEHIANATAVRGVGAAAIAGQVMNSATPLPMATWPAGTHIPAGAEWPMHVPIPTGVTLQNAAGEPFVPPAPPAPQVVPATGFFVATPAAGWTAPAGGHDVPFNSSVPRGTFVPAGTIIGEFDVTDHEMRFEFTSNTYVPINVLAKTAIPPNMIADFNRLFEFADSLQRTPPSAIRDYYANTHQPNKTGQALQNAVDTFISNENAFFAGLLHERFNDMLRLHEVYSANIKREHTSLGTRMSRLDMIHHRLEEDEIHYTALLSRNEDADVAGTIIRRNGAQAAFRDSLQSISMMTQLSLANFINR